MARLQCGIDTNPTWKLHVLHILLVYLVVVFFSKQMETISQLICGLPKLKNWELNFSLKSNCITKKGSCWLVSRYRRSCFTVGFNILSVHCRFCLPRRLIILCVIQPHYITRRHKLRHAYGAAFRLKAEERNKIHRRNRHAAAAATATCGSGPADLFDEHSPAWWQSALWKPGLRLEASVST